MTKYQKYRMQGTQPPRPWKIHPIWRGIGCIMLFLIPIMSYAGAVLLVQANAEQGWLPVPFELARTITLPFIGPVRSLLAILLVAVLLALIGFGVLMVLYSLLYSLAGPPRYGPLDMPPIRRSRRRR